VNQVKLDKTFQLFNDKTNEIISNLINDLLYNHINIPALLPKTITDQYTAHE
jgi:hypothetical protein